MKTTAILVSFWLAVLASPQTATLEEVHHEFFPHPDDPGRRIEFFWTAPEGDGPWPVLLFVHGHQFPERPGARIYLDRGILKSRAAEGFVAAAVSQPGYGSSDGPPDFCGPISQNAVRRALEQLRGNPRVDAGRIVVYGYSRGAITASMVALREPGLAGVVLGGGVYDMQDAYSRLGEMPPGEGGIKENIRHEAGAAEQSFRIRSVLLNEDPIRVPTLILHGEDDPIAFVDQARRLARRLEEAGTPVTLVVFEGVGHGIPREQRAPHVRAFLEKYALPGR